MDYKDYIKRMILVVKISALPIDDINMDIGFLRLQNICLYEPCLQYVREKFLKKTSNHQNYKKRS